MQFWFGYETDFWELSGRLEERLRRALRPPGTARPFHRPSAPIERPREGRLGCAGQKSMAWGRQSRLTGIRSSVASRIATRRLINGA